MRRQVSRRTFLRQSAAGVAAALGPTLIPSKVWAAAVPPSDRITLGFIGVGGMGRGHLDYYLSDENTRVLAVADVHGESRGAALQMAGRGCDGYTDFRHLLDRKDIDAVVIATPDHWHTLTAIYACQAGKDIYCEKPLTLTIEEAKKLRETVRRYGVVFQTGSQQRCGDNFRFGCELVRNGRIGKVHTVETGIGHGPTCGWEPDMPVPPELDWNFWLGPAPYVPYTARRCIYNFRWFYEYSGGKMTDWGAHHMDIAQWGLGMDGSGPVRVEGTGTFPTSGLYDTLVSFEVTYTYADGTRMITRPSIPSSGLHGGTKFTGDKGWVHVDRGCIDASPKDILYEPIGPDGIHLYEASHYHGDNWVACRRNFIDCIRTRKRPICDVEVGASSVIVCHLGNIACRLGRPIQWDPVKEDIVGDEEARRWVSKPYRAPWHL